MIGYKGFNKDLSCHGFQYEIGETYTLEGDLVICENGFHFCKNISDVYNYKGVDGTRICKIEALGEIVSRRDKYCTNKIKILEEIADISIRRGNRDNTCTGFFNTGEYNTGDNNTGNFNAGMFNTGDHNIGDRNTGHLNTGNCNSGDCNTGDYNISDDNTGNYNSGDCNTGSFNSGNYNTGNFNAGNCNTGGFNTGNFNTGFFNTTDSTIRLFNKESNMTMSEFYESKAYKIINSIFINYNKTVEWLDKFHMTEEEKDNHPESEVTLGYLKSVNNTDNLPQDVWNILQEEDKKEILSLPNFDKDIFKQCTGIDVDV